MPVEQEWKLRKTVIECKDVCKTFITPEGEHEVVRDFNLTAKENEFLVLFGPGQCGKTTIINMIAGFEKVTSGNMKFMDKEITKPDPSRGVVFQSTALFPWMTTMGNVEYGPKMAGVAKAERQKRAQKYIDLVGLKGFEKSFPVQLSGGMKQRVGIARAYCNEPQLMLMDEPFGALDAQTRYLMEDEVLRIWEQDKRTVVFVTNNIEEALTLGDRIILLSNCPATIKEIYVPEIKKPRDNMSKEFLELRSIIENNTDMAL